MFSFYVHLKNALHQHLQKASFALPQLLSSQFIWVILQYAWCTDDHVHVDNDGEDFVEDDVDGDGDDDVHCKAPQIAVIPPGWNARLQLTAFPTARIHSGLIIIVIKTS